MNSPNLLTLMNLVDTRYPSSRKEYPSLDVLSGDQRRSFIVNHSVLHMCKVTGTLSSECEAGDHGKELDTDILRAAAAKMLINSIKLAVDLGMNAETLTDELSRIMGIEVTA